jgi:hypothetical protein
MDHVSLDRTRADDGDLDDEIVECARLHRHLGAAFDLERAERVGLSDHGVGARILGSRDLIAAVLPELRGAVNRGPLEGDARQKLDHVLPGIGYDNWDLNRRILLALHHLQKSVSVSRQTLSAPGLSEPEAEFVLFGPKEGPKRKAGYSTPKHILL